MYSYVYFAAAAAAVVARSCEDYVVWWDQLTQLTKKEEIFREIFKKFLKIVFRRVFLSSQPRIHFQGTRKLV